MNLDSRKLYLAAHAYKRSMEIILISKTGSFTPIGRCKLVPSELTVTLYDFAVRGGRHMHQLACVNPLPPFECPEHIVKVMYKDNQWYKRKLIPFPQALRDVWNTLTPEVLSASIRAHALAMYNLSHAAKLGASSYKLDSVVSILMAKIVKHEN